MKKVLAGLLGLVLIISMITGCSGGSATPSGKYYLSAYEVGGVDYLAFLTLFGADTSNFYIDFQSNGKVAIHMEILDEIEHEEGTFTVDGKKVIITIDGEDTQGTIDGKKITLEMEEDGELAKMVFEKK